MGDDERVKLTTLIDRDLHRAAKRKMVDDGQTFQAVVEAALQAYVNGHDPR
jgi:hypothetical protein